MPPEGSSRHAAGSHAAGRAFLGWRVVGATFGVLTLAFGVTYSFPAFFDALSRDFPGSRGNVALIFALAGFIIFVVGAVAGPMADRIGSRRTVTLGLVLIAAGVIAASFGRTLWQVLAAYGLGVGVGAGIAYVPALSPVQRWFMRHRGRASGFAVTGIGVGTFVGPLIAGAIISVGDWRMAWLVLGGTTLIFGVAAAQFLIDSPEKVGQRPDGDPPSAAAAAGAATSPPAAQGWSLKAALRTRPFWTLYGANLALSVPLLVPFVHLVPSARDLAISESTALFLVSLIGVGSIVGRFGLGSVADRLGRRPSLVTMFAGLTLMLVLWTVATAAWHLAIFAVVFGACYGGYVALMPSVIIDYLGPRNAGGIIGILYTSVAPGTLLGPPLAGYAFDLWGSYTVPLLVGVGFTLLATICTMLTPNPAKWRAANPPR